MHSGMSGTIDEQLTQLAQLHDSGALTDAEFEAAKATALGGAPPEDRDHDLPPPGSGDPTVLTVTEGLARIPLILMIVLALAGGTAVHGIASGLEWAPIQAPAAPVVCPGGTMHSGFDVSYSVSAKGISDAVSCERDGVSTPVSGWLVFGVLSIIYAVPLFLLLLWLKVRSRRRLMRPTGTPPST